MSRIENSPCDPKLLSPLALAFVGDGVYDLFVRERLVCEANRPVKKLNEEKVSIVRCSSQAKLVEKLMPILTEEELDVLKRGRNAHTQHIPKNATSADYHSATALEALLGYLYLAGRIERIRELLKN
ncbi:MAG: ribonuclease III domain-containing protein [Candidatus Pseudoruminococcus sp.]|uniref:Mini-ribonuclease 3 n=1 Tax=Candidatus Pseudoruminococcus sp. TaxID=3101048 RepID=UPI002A7A02A2|nr:ribonuclease III [Ruminococcus sp.]MDY2783487.1 ribonuclease III domain-containing protein [Candidatus Pseudoruminococcus sp.]